MLGGQRRRFRRVGVEIEQLQLLPLSDELPLARQDGPLAGAAPLAPEEVLVERLRPAAQDGQQAASSAVGSISNDMTGASMVRPPWKRAGHETMNGVRMPPS